MSRQMRFNLGDGEARRDRGIERAVMSREEILSLARSLAYDIASRRPDRRLTADEVQAALMDMGYSPAQLGNAAGAIFRGPDWEWTGEIVRSQRISNNARVLRVWRLRKLPE